MSRRFDGKVAVITGAARGQGRVAALRFAQEGAAVALTDVLETELAETVSLVEAAGGTAVAHVGDIAAPATIDALVSAAARDLGGVDILHNNAGILVPGSIEETTIEQFDRLMHVNCLSQVLAIQRCIPEMRKRGGGSIVNVSSIGGLAAVSHMTVYCASKAAVIGLTRAVARDLAPDGIRCNAVCPGGIDTPMAAQAQQLFASREEFVEFATERQLIKRFANSDDVISVVLFLASDESSFMTGAALPVEGGHTAW